MIPLYEFFKTDLQLVDQVVEFFTSSIRDINYFQHIKEICLNNKFLQKNTLNQNIFLSLGYLSTEDFLIYMGETNQIGKEINQHMVELLLNHLVKNNILLLMQSGSLCNNKPLYQPINHPGYLRLIVDWKLTYNIVFGFSYIANRYRKAIVKIIVQTKTNDESLGTGFFVANPNIIVITNKHVAENKITNIFDESESLNFEFNSEEVMLSDSDDLAFIPIKKVSSLKEKNLEKEEPIVCLLPNLTLTMLDEIITLGYPSIPRTKFSSLVAHKGEVNSVTQNYFGNNIFVFSAKTSPGSSGSPIIDRTGRFIGIVTENLFEEEAFKEKGIIPYHAGIPAKVIWDNLSKYKLINDNS